MQLASPKNLDRLERPREKLLAAGVTALSDHELLQVVLGSGIKGVNVAELAAAVMQVFSSRAELDLDIDSLSHIKGLGKAKAAKLLAALEFVNRFKTGDAYIIDAPHKVLPLVSQYANAKQEHLICISLDGAHRVIATRVITIGTLTNTLVHPREVYRDAITDHAAGVILVHNHPSGICKPSEDDIQATKNLIHAGKLLGIELLDHLIIARNDCWCSILKFLSYK